MNDDNNLATDLRVHKNHTNLFLVYVQALLQTAASTFIAENAEVAD